MTPASIHEWLNIYRSNLQDRLNLSQWDIKIKVIDKKAPGDSTATGHTKAEVVGQLYQYKAAKIVLYAPNIDTVEELYSTLLHEMLHIKLAPIEHVYELIYANLPKTEPLGIEAIDEFMSKMRELTVWELEQMLKTWRKE